MQVIWCSSCIYMNSSDKTESDVNRAVDRFHRFYTYVTICHVSDYVRVSVFTLSLSKIILFVNFDEDRLLERNDANGRWDGFGYA